MLPKRKQYNATHRVADAAEGKIRRAIQMGFAMARVRLRQKDLIRNGAAVIPWEIVQADLYAQILPVLMDTLEAGALAHVGTVQKASPRDIAASLNLVFDRTNPEALRWAQQHAAELVTRITGESQLAIRAIIARMYADQVTPQAAARELRSIIGLTERDALAVDNLRRGLEQRNRSQAQIDRAVEAAGAKYLRQRAETIARTESMTASTRGQQELWRQAEGEGLLEPDTRQQWIITPDELLCPECSAMPDENPDGVPLGVPFRSSDGGLIDGPPLHPSCRCTVALAESVPTS